MNRLFLYIIIVFTLIQIGVNCEEANLERSQYIRESLYSFLSICEEDNSPIMLIELDKVVNQNHIYIMEYRYDSKPYLLFYSDHLKLYYIVTSDNFIVYYSESFREIESYIDSRRY